MKKYDYLIIGCGLYGAVCAEQLSKKYKVLIMEKNDFFGGSIYTKKINGIDVHCFGPHIFHTSNKDVWAYINNFSEFNSFINSPIANYNGEIYNLPFNMNTFTKIWNDVKTPLDAKKKIEEEIKLYGTFSNKNLKEKAISLVGKTIYEKLIKEYTEKQWGKTCEELPPEIISRLPIRFTFNNNYFEDDYQGIPKLGYTEIIRKMIVGCDLKLNCDGLLYKNEFFNIANKVIFTGPIDEFYNYKYGHLEYRSLKFDNKILNNCENFQGNAVVNYTSNLVPYTRITEHKFFNSEKNQNGTVITYEYPESWSPGKASYYPINNKKNNETYKKYLCESKKDPRIHFGGRLGEYKYLNMDKIIENALEYCKGELNNEN